MSTPPATGPVRVLFGQPRFSDAHEWHEVVGHFPAAIAERVVVETVPHGGALARLQSDGPPVHVVVPIMSPLPRDAFRHRSIHLVQQFGVGVESIDIAAAAEHGVHVANMPGVNAPFVAEHAVALLLSLLHRLPEADAGFIPGMWGSPAGRSLAGSEVCIIGLGAIGRGVAARLAPFGARLTGVYRSPVNAATLPAGMTLVPSERMAEALATADAVIMAATHTTGQPAVLSAKLVDAIKPGAFVVNVARGAAIDNDACLAALDRGRLAGLGLDVFPTEPYPADGPLATHPRVLATAHIGALTSSYFANAATRLGTAIERSLNNQVPDNALTVRP